MDDRMCWVAIVMSALLAGSGSGCSDPVRDRQIKELGPEEPGVTPGADHRPGQPCLHCHSEGGPASNKPFAVAGTVYETEAPDSAGAENITVQFVDANGGGPRENPVTTQSGNFFVTKENWPDLAFPLRVGLYTDPGKAPNQVMKSFISREGSCNFCHRPNIDLGAIEDEDERDKVLDELRSSAGQIYMRSGSAK